MATRIARACLGIALVVASALAHAGKPEVLVQFEIAVPAFERNLPERAKAEQNIRKALATELARTYAFANWSTQPAAQPRAQLGRLVLRLEQNPDTRPSPQILVRWLGASGATGAAPADLSLAPIEIYSPGNPNWDTNNRGNFETRLLGKTMEKMRTDAFNAEFFKGFLRRLPIASTIVPQTADRVIEVPVPWDELALSSESELTVVFDKPVDQTRREGSLTLGQIVARISGAEAASPALRGSITKASFDAKTVVLDQQNWNDQVPAMLNGAQVRCYISVYKPRDPLASESGVLLGL